MPLGCKLDTGPFSDLSRELVREAQERMCFNGRVESSRGGDVRTGCVGAVITAAFVAWQLSLFASSPAAGQPTQWKFPRTAWGDPDFQGVTWNFATMTPLERPRGVENAVFTETEAAAFERQTAERQRATTNNGYDWWDAGAAHLDHRRTSLIVDPLDGRVPPLTAEAQRRAAAARPAPAGPAAGPEDFPLNTRCIWWQNAGPPMLPSPYNDNLQFVQTRNHIVISNENIHDARIIPMDGRPHGAIRQWLGDSRGRWEGNTLVVDTINFSNKTSLRGSNERLHVVERFIWTDADTMEYRFTVEDPTVWTRPWTVKLALRRTNQLMYEFACHEGNFLSIKGLLEVARFLEKP